MRGYGRRTWSVLGLVLALAAGVTPLVAQQGAPLSGRVTEKGTGKPLIGARVALLGTTVVETTNGDGRYAIRTPVSGEVRVRVNAIGYQSETRTTTAVSGAATVIDFDLTAVAVQIDEIVTTATGEQSKLEIGTVVESVKPDSIAAYNAVSNLSDVLNSRAPGVTVQTAGGTTGGGSRIRIRGANSISLSNEPIVYIDGVRANGNANGGDDISGFTAGQSFSRLNDINPDDIESMEVLKGPSATTQYGVDAANGVIVIRTKRGSAGRTKWNFYAEGGILQDKNTYPPNTTAFGDFGGGSSPFCFLSDVALGACAGQDSLVQFSPLRDPAITPFGTGWRQQYGMNVSGGTDNLQYYVSGDFNDEVGVYSLAQTYIDSLNLQRGTTSVPFAQRHPNGIRKVNLRSSVHANVGKTGDLTATLGWLNSDGRLPQNDNNIFGIIPQGVLGGFDRNSAWFGSPTYGPAELFSLSTTQTVQRLTGSVTGNWRPKGWLSSHATLGLDQSQIQNTFFSPAGEGPAANDLEKGFKNDNKFTSSVYSFDVGAQATASIAGLSSKTSAGIQYYRNSLNGTLTQGQFFAPGSSAIGAAASQVASDTVLSSVTGGGYLEEQFGYNDRLYLTVGGRIDKASGFGQSFKSVFSPKANISWIALDQRSGFLNFARFRVAYGQSTVQPGAFSALNYFTAGPVAIDDQGTKLAGTTLGGLGNANLKPEKSREFEGGVDVSLLNNRVSLELTGYSKKTTDALVNQPIAPSAGTGAATNRFVNLASVRNQGIELGLNARVLTGQTLSWDLGFSGSLLRNRVLELGVDDQGNPIQPFYFGLGGSSQRVIAGYPIGGLWAPQVTFADANGDGVIDASEVTVGDTGVFIGNVLPTRQLSANSSWGLFKNIIRVSTTFDYRGGYYQNNSTTQFQCLFATCAALYVPGTPLADQAAALTAGATSSYAYAQKADFLRWRELSLTFFAPDHIARSLGAERASLTLAGRNLWITTKYGGVDPEVNTTGQTNQSVADFLTQPPVRYWTARVNLTF